MTTKYILMTAIKKVKVTLLDYTYIYTSSEINIWVKLLYTI